MEIVAEERLCNFKVTREAGPAAQPFSVKFLLSFFSSHGGLPTIVCWYSTSIKQYAKPDKEVLFCFSFS